MRDFVHAIKAEHFFAKPHATSAYVSIVGDSKQLHVKSPGNMHYLGAFREWANKLIESLTIVFERWGREVEAVSARRREGEKEGISCCSAKD